MLNLNSVTNNFDYLEFLERNFGGRQPNNKQGSQHCHQTKQTY